MSIRLPLAALIAAAVLALPAAAEATTTIEVEPGGSFTANSSAVTFEGGGIAVVCPVTLSGSLNTEFAAEEPGATAGSISALTPGRCTGGLLERALSLPWDIRYGELVGSEPEVATALLFTVSGFAVNFPIFGGFVNCLYRGTAGIDLTVSGDNPWTGEALSFLRSVSIALVRGFACPVSIAVSGLLQLPPEEKPRVTAGKPLAKLLNPLGLLEDWVFPETPEGEEGTFLIRNISAGNLTVNKTELYRAGTRFSIPGALNLCVPQVILGPARFCPINVRYGGGATARNWLVAKSAGYVVAVIGIGAR